MGLFDFLRKEEKPIIIPESDKNLVSWFFTEDARKLFDDSVDVYKEEMYEVWFSQFGPSKMIPCINEKSSPYRKEYPCTFFADYLRALKTMDSPYLAINAVDLAMEDDGNEAIPYPDCLKAECNPLINFAIKIKPIFYSKNGKDLQFNGGLKMIIAYLHDAFVGGVDESNEPWIYEHSLWFNEKGKVREASEIEKDIKAKVKNKNYINK